GPRRLGSGAGHQRVRAQGRHLHPRMEPARVPGREVLPLRLFEAGAGRVEAAAIVGSGVRRLERQADSRRRLILPLPSTSTGRRHVFNTTCKTMTLDPTKRRKFLVEPSGIQSNYWSGRMNVRLADCLSTTGSRRPTTWDRGASAC